LTFAYQGHILIKNVKNVFLFMPLSKQTDLKERLFFTAQDVARAYGITLPSAHVLCTRYVRQGVFIRLKKNFYVLERNWERYGNREFFKIGNFLQVPSYVSCMSALAFYGITTQVQRGWFENITTRRSAKIEAGGVLFLYHKVQPRLYFGFTKQDGVFIASPEKAFLDAAYLHSLGLYPLDWSSLNLDALDKRGLVALLEPFSPQVKERIGKECRI